MSGKYTFKALFFEATRLCNFDCPMCMASSNKRSVVKDSVKKELSTDEIEEYILKAAKEIGIHTIMWSGGEFVLRPDAVELVRRATDYGYTSVVATNGSKMTRDMLSALKDASNGSVVISVGINSIEDENAWTRDADCNLAMKVLKLCKELGMRRNTVVSIGQHNLETIDQTLQWLEDQQIPYNRSPFTARGSGVDYWDKLHVRQDDMKSTIHPALRKHPNGYISYTPFFLSPEVHNKYSKGIKNVTVPQNPSIGCWCGTWLGVNAEGDISPCAILLDDFKCGNIRDKGFEQLIDESEAMQSVLDRSKLKGKCGRCRYQYTCGGCRAQAYYTHGDLMAEDPTCFFEPIDETTVCEHEEETNKNFKVFAAMSRQAEKINAWQNKQNALKAMKTKEEASQRMPEGHTKTQSQANQLKWVDSRAERKYG